MLPRVTRWNPRGGLWSRDASASSECLNSLLQRERQAGLASTKGTTMVKEGVFYSDDCLLKEVPRPCRCAQWEGLDVAGAPSRALGEPPQTLLKHRDQGSAGLDGPRTFFSLISPKSETSLDIG
ncbi:hypothetical protein HJG60_009187 [Phyllostomus discolor]|uniref:Uncharacterized protein n=1 Tax=Phyllostomus discolor TaxID=89673 RepID=A0A833YMG7_9CHIR|nr:hypothetical protein HJG60_009187 [Phyllostomus discolor]